MKYSHLEDSHYFVPIAIEKLLVQWDIRLAPSSKSLLDAFIWLRRTIKPTIILLSVFQWSEGRHYRHAAINNIVYRAMSAAKIPSRLETSGLSRSDGKRPDGVSVVPWRNGKLLIWDATSPDTFASSYSSLASADAGLVAARAEELKEAKYAFLVPHHIFTPVAIETGGVVGPQSLAFIRELGRRLELVTGDANSFVHLLQRLSIAVQQGNAASILGSIDHSLPDEN